MKTQELDALLQDKTALGLKSIEHLEPLIGDGETVFPPTYAGATYQIDRNPATGESVVVLDSVGSQANRTEPLFKSPPYSKLVPQVHVTLGTRVVNLLDIGHRGADAAIRMTELGVDLSEAFRKLERNRNGAQLAKIAPTSLVFGAWDSRETKAKARRVVRHTIEGSDVFELERSAQYSPVVNYVDEGLVTDAELKTKSKSKKNVGAIVGMLDNPATGALGGVRVKEIRRLGLLNLNVLRSIQSETPEESNLLQSYLFGLALVAFACPAELDLREGCELAHKIETKPTILVRRLGTEESISLSPESALTYAESAAKNFGVGKNRDVKFDKTLAKIAFDKAAKE